MSNSVESLRSSYENDNEWSLRKKFLESNRDKLPLERLLCLSMCYINHVSYGVSYSPGVMFKLKEMSQGLPSHLDIVKEKNSIAFVKPTVEKSKYGNFVFSSEASFPKTVLQPGAGLGFASSSSSSSSSQTDAAKSSFSANSKTNTNVNKYPGFVKSGSTASENSKPCFAPATETASDMLQYSGFVKPVSNVSPTQNSNTFYNSDKYMNLAKPNSNPYFGGHPNSQSAKYRSRPLLKGLPESKRPMPANTITKKTFLTATSEAASNSLQDTSEIEVSYREKKFYALSESLKGMKGSPAAVNAIQKLNMAITKVKMFVQTEISPFVSRSSTVFKCRVKIADVQVGEGEGSNKKAAKHEAFSRALSLLAQPTLKIQEQNGRQVLVGSNVPRPHLSRMTLLKSDDPPAAAASNNNANAGRKRPMSSWGHFLIMEHKLVNNAIAVIRHSADINRMPIEYVFTPDPQGTSCQLFINDEPIMECVAESKPVAKMEVSEKALQWLKERCWTIMVKQEADSDNIDVSRDEIMGEIEKQFKPIPSDNVGNQLLRKMGWEGGGIGAEGNKGIADPIMVNQVIDRQGLGCRTSAGVSTKFDTFVREILLNYVKSKKQKDLVFTAEFSREERAIIHKEARRYNLKSISRGTGEDRYLIISRKRSAGQLFNHILASGGSTQKYELIPPLKKDP